MGRGRLRNRRPRLDALDLTARRESTVNPYGRHVPQKSISICEIDAVGSVQRSETYRLKCGIGHLRASPFATCTLQWSLNESQYVLCGDKMPFSRQRFSICSLCRDATAAPFQVIASLLLLGLPVIILATCLYFLCLWLSGDRPANWSLDMREMYSIVGTLFVLSIVTISITIYGHIVGTARNLLWFPDEQSIATARSIVSAMLQNDFRSFCSLASPALAAEPSIDEFRACWSALTNEGQLQQEISHIYEVEDLSDLENADGCPDDFDSVVSVEFQLGSQQVPSLLLYLKKNVTYCLVSLDFDLNLG